MGLDLGLLVVAGVAVMRVAVGLVDDLAARVAERRDGRDVDDLRDLLLECGAQHVLGPEHVRLVHPLALVLGDPDLVDRGAVNDRVGAAHRLAQCLLVGDVALDERDPELGEIARLGRVADERRDLVAALGQLADDVAADEAGSPVTKTFTSAPSLDQAQVPAVISPLTVRGGPATALCISSLPLIHSAAALADASTPAWFSAIVMLTSVPSPGSTTW